MAVNESDDVLARAAKELREHDEPGWSEASGAVLRAVRGATRRSAPVESAWPDDTSTEPGRGDRLQVSDLVVVRLVAHALRQVTGVAPGRVVLRLEGRRCEGAEVQVVARYGTDLEAAAQQVRAVVTAALEDVLGGGVHRRVDVRVDDVVVHDPRV